MLFRKASSHHLRLLALSLLVQGSSVLAGGTLTVSKGTTVTVADYRHFNGALYTQEGRPSQATLKLAYQTASDFVLEGTLEVKRTDPTQKVSDVLIVNNFTIKKGGTVVLNNNALTVFANTLTVEEGARVIPFLDGARKAGPGVPQNSSAAPGNVPGAAGNTGFPGNAGYPGEAGGTITIYAQTFKSDPPTKGSLTLDVSGQAGGDGSNGGAAGNGAAGQKGGGAECNYFLGQCTGCAHAGDNGGPGGPGGSGGQGGPGGKGGDAGVASFFYVNSSTVSDVNPLFILQAGSAGASGQGGDPGAGGGPGDGGNGNAACGGGRQGSPGAPGGRGSVGVTPSPAAQGSKVLRKLDGAADVEAAYKVAKSGVEPAPKPHLPIGVTMR